MHKKALLTMLADVERTCRPYCSSHGTFIHGLPHLRKVAHVAARIAAYEGADWPQAMVGGFLHDCARKDDGGGQEHAVESAKVAKVALARHYPNMDAERLLYAINHHAGGLTTKDPLIGAIWDSDRLDLVRLGAEIDPRLLSTRYARRLVRLQKARAHPRDAY
jgi:uncharacterized protein